MPIVSHETVGQCLDTTLEIIDIIMLQAIKTPLKYLHRKAFGPYLKATEWLSHLGGGTFCPI